MKTLKILMVSLLALLSFALFSCTGQEGNDSDNDINDDKEVQEPDVIVEINTVGNILLDVKAGEKISISEENTIKFIFYSGEVKRIPLTKENIEYFDIRISFDLFSQKVTIEALDLYIIGYIEFAEDINYVLVRNAQELRDALINTDIFLILIPEGTFRINATYILSEKVIIGKCQELSVIEVTSRVLSKANLLFQRQVTIKNVTINAHICNSLTSGINALKISLYYVDGAQYLVEKALLKNITVNGAGGLNIYGVKNAILDGVTVCVGVDSCSRTHFTALTLAISVVTMRNTVIGRGTTSSGFITHSHSSEIDFEYKNHPMQVILEENNDIAGIFYISGSDYQKIAQNNIDHKKDSSPMVGMQMRYWFRVEISGGLLEDSLILFVPSHLLPLYNFR